MTEEKMIEKIKNLLDLASNNTNEHEAIAAALKAQELMAKYNISMEQFQDKSEEIAETRYAGKKGYSQTFKKYLSTIIARNFRCETYVSRKYGLTEIVFYGYKKDVNIALQVFTYIFETANKLANKYYREAKKAGKLQKGTWNDYMIGFANGVDEALQRQCTALMIVTPKEVVESFEELSKNWRSVTPKISLGDMEAIKAGRIDGKSTMSAREIEERGQGL